jgi:hypothetical protein
MHSSRLRAYFELHHGSLDMLASGTFEGPQIVSRLLWFNARQIHLCCALWAIRTRVNGRVIERVFGKRHFQTPLFAGGSTATLSHRRLTEIAVGDVPQYDLFP